MPSLPAHARPALALLSLGVVSALVAGVLLARPSLEIRALRVAGPGSQPAVVVSPHRLEGASGDASYQAEVTALRGGAVLALRPQGCVQRLGLDGVDLPYEPGPVGCGRGQGAGLLLEEPGPHRVDVLIAPDRGRPPGLELRAQRGGLLYLPSLLGLALGLAAVLAGAGALLAPLAGRRWLPWATAGGLLATMIAVLALAPAAPFHFPEAATPYHRLLAEALLGGGVALDAPPGSYDLCGHEGRQVLCWGPGPALLMLPVAWLGEGLPTGTAAGAALALIALFGWYGCLLELRRGGVLALDWVDLLVLSGAAVFGTQLLFLSASGEVWHLGQSAAIAMGLLALFFLVRPGPASALLASCCFGLAALSRFSLMALLPAFFVMSLLLQGRGLRCWRRLGVRALLVGAPLLGALGLQLAYNRARFGSLLDFGWRTQRGSEHLIHDLTATGTLALSYLPRNLQAYLLDPLDYGLLFPHVGFSGRGNALWSYQPALLLLLLLGLWCLPGLPLRLRRLWAWLGTLLGRATPGPERLRLLAGTPVAPVLLWGSLGCWLAYLGFLLLLFTTGWVTVGSRLIANVLPFFLVLLAFAASRMPRTLGWRFLLYATLFTGAVAQWLMLRVMV